MTGVDVIDRAGTEMVWRGGAHPALVDLFTNGWCTVLAAALMQLDPERFTLVETDEEQWHVAVADERGWVWDIQGARPADEFEAQWGEFWPAYVLNPEATAAAAAGDWFPVADHLTGTVFGQVDRQVWSIVLGVAEMVLAANAPEEEAA